MHERHLFGVRSQTVASDENREWSNTANVETTQENRQRATRKHLVDVKLWNGHIRTFQQKTPKPPQPFRKSKYNSNDQRTEAPRQSELRVLTFLRNETQLTSIFPSIEEI
ncbi:hypothetical protein IG631_10998 [Alternaria alternata]|jgi:hypothetical protein|nr:hypothetical protein IG631_10998 [Alternaria alternata]